LKISPPIRETTNPMNRLKIIMNPEVVSGPVSFFLEINPKLQNLKSGE
jgi:hypothetical protein